jgi:hypothetical protein
MTVEEFMNLAFQRACEAEIKLNEDARLRWHVKEG